MTENYAYLSFPNGSARRLHDPSRLVDSELSWAIYYRGQVWKVRYQFDMKKLLAAGFRTLARRSQNNWASFHTHNRPEFTSYFFFVIKLTCYTLGYNLYSGKESSIALLGLSTLKLRRFQPLHPSFYELWRSHIICVWWINLKHASFLTRFCCTLIWSYTYLHFWKS